MDKDKINGTRGIVRALITVPQNETDATNPFNQFQAVAVPTDNKQLRYSFDNDEFFYQVLRTGKANIVSNRLDSGLPIFDNHPEMEDAGALNQLGITTEYSFEASGIVVTCKLGSRSDDCLRSDIQNGIVKTMSIEGDVHEYMIERKTGEVPVYYADLWEPTSLSFAPVPQDISAQIEVKRAIQKQINNTTPKADKSIITKLINKF
jgi:hypothetical protein